MLQLVTRGAFARGAGIGSLRVGLGQPAARRGIERAHAQRLLVGRDRLGPLPARLVRHPERHGRRRVVVIGGGERGRELDRLVVAAELDQRARELAGDERLGLADGKRLLVRLPFPIPGDVGFEAMWVEVTSYATDTVTGTVVDEPIATDVARGDRVTRPRTEVEDVRELP